MRHYALMVVGGGTGGLRTAISAAQEGFKTVLIEPSVLGGTCLNHGCIPTKALLYSAHVYQLINKASIFGIRASAVKPDFKAIMKRMHGIVQEGQSHIYKSIRKMRNLTLIRKPARFLSKNVVQAGEERLSADRIIIATGSKSMFIPIPGLTATPYWISDDVLNLKKLPKSVILIGGGYISMEFATFFNDLGSKVIVLERLPHVLPLLDEDVAAYVTWCYEKEGVEIHTNVNILHVQERNGKKTVAANDVRNPKSKQTNYQADELLLAIGRVPNTDGLDLEKARVKLGERKNIEVNDYLQTSNPSIYAMGDVTGKAPFAHAVKRESKLLLDNLLHRKKNKIMLDLVPYAVFTNPPIAGVGLTEKEAKERKYAYAVMKAPYASTGRARIIEDDRGFVKVIYDKKTRKLLGCTIIGPNADDLIHEYVAVMSSASPTIDVIQKTIHIHPTLSEVNDSLEPDE